MHRGGMRPIEKNISVTDELGNSYEATYIRRARGLVKKGRARFIDQNTICLARPPEELEEIRMSDKIENPVLPETPSELTMHYVLSRIDRIIADTSYIHEALHSIREMNVNEGHMGGQGDSARGEAISHTVQSRETTNQQLLRLLEEMYNDLKEGQKPPNAGISRAGQMMDFLKGVNWDEYPKGTRDMMEQAFKEQLSRHY